MYAARASNAELWDVEGRRYIDFATGIAVLNTGHRHAAVTAAVTEQLTKLTHACFQVTPYESYVRLAEELNRLAPGDTAKKTLFLSTGAEAVENAVKIARFATGRTAVIAFTGAFHGRTLACLALTGKVQPYKAGFGPMLPDVYHLPYPMAYHGISASDSLAALEHLFKADVDPSRVAALIVEPVLGEGGFYIAPPEFLRALKARCEQHGILFIADEIQTGFGRTGRMFALEHSGIEADLLTVAKSIAGGLPLAAVIGKAAIMDAPAPGGLGGTFAGSPLACAAGLAVLAAMADERLVERADHVGAQLLAALRDWQTRQRGIGEVRGIGAMVAMELVKNGDPSQPDAERSRALVQAAGRRGLIVLSCGIYSNVIRLLPPLTIPDQHLHEGLAILQAALAETG